MESDHLREAIDACRPEGDDLQQAEFAALAEALKQDQQVQMLLSKVQHVDTAIREACHDVDVPADLAERLQTAVAKVGAADSNPVTAVETSEKTGRPLWRRSFLAGVAVLAAVVLLIVGLSFLGSADELDGLAFAEKVQNWPDESEFKGPWRPVTQTLSSWPYSVNLTTKPAKWRRYRTSLDANAVAYLDNVSFQSDVWLFVIRTKQGSKLPTSPPLHSFRTGARQIAVWKEKDCVYVLIIDGLDDYRRIAPRGPGLA